MEGVLARRPAGVISVLSGLKPAQRSQLETRGIPFVVIDPDGEPAPDVPSIGATNWSGGLTATRHLLESGHRRIAMIGGPAHVLCSRARIDGYRARVAPRLTTVRQPLQEMAVAAGRLVLALARGEQPDHRRIELATSLVVRESTGPPTR